jgi:hypothetical protein
MPCESLDKVSFPLLDLLPVPLCIASMALLFYQLRYALLWLEETPFGRQPFGSTCYQAG